MKKDKKEKKAKEKKAKKLLEPAKSKAAEDKNSEVGAMERALPQADPLAYALATVGGKWKLRILWALSSKKGRRYGDIKRDIPEITDMMLSQSLRELTADALVERTQYQEIPPRVEYAITAKGLEVLPAIEALIKWANKRLEEL